MAAPDARGLPVRTITIEFGPGVLFDVVDEYGRRCNGLAFEEMVGQVIELTHPSIGSARFRMLTPEQWQEQEERRAREIAARRQSDMEQGVAW